MPVLNPGRELVLDLGLGHDVSGNVQRVAKVISLGRFPLECEKRCQSEINEAFLRQDFTVEREAKVDGGFIDFLVDGDIGVEVKLKGNAGAIRRQLYGYALDPKINFLILATSKPVALPNFMNGKRVIIIDIAGAWL